jgi:hypothetical protein
MPIRSVFTLALMALFAACSSPSYTYRYIPGKTAELRGGFAVPPPNAPEKVQAAIAAGNRIAGLPYCYGGGHGRGIDSAYDCSGAASYVLRAAGKLGEARTSTGFRSYGEAGAGEWITVYAAKGHVFLSVAGLRFDTGWTSAPKGPQWTMKDRPADGAVLRHPDGL